MATIVFLHRARILAWIAWDSPGFFQWLAKQPWYTKILIDWTTAIPLRQGQQVLEVGCGPGLLSHSLHERGIQMMGLDRSSAMIARAKSNDPDCEFIEGDALAIPLPNENVDMAIAASVVNIVSDPQKLVSEMARVVRPGGHVSVLFPTPKLSQDAAMIAKQRNIRGLSAAALTVWAEKPPKREPDTIQSLFTDSGLLDSQISHFFEGTIACVTGQVNVSQTSVHTKLKRP